MHPNDLVAAKDPNEQSRLTEAPCARLSPHWSNSGSTRRSSRTLHPPAHTLYRSHMPFDCAQRPNCGPWNICTQIQNLHQVCLCPDPDTGCKRWRRRLHCRKNCRTCGKRLRHHSILLGTCTFCSVRNRHR